MTNLIAVTGNPHFCVATMCGVWVSDFDGRKADSVTLTITDNGDGTFTEDIVAYC
jgi:hypothetical protein